MNQIWKNIGLVGALVFGVAVSMQAQFVGVRSLFLSSTVIDNPASVGNLPCLDMRMGVRSQWTGFEDAPLTSFATLSGRLSDATTFGHGLGGYVMTDAAGPWSTTRLSMAYSTKVRLTNGARLSAGLGLGLVQYRLDVQSLDFPEVASTEDPAVMNSSNTQTVFPGVDFGLWYEDNRNFAAFSLQNVMANPLSDLTQSTSSGRVAVLMAGKFIKLDNKFAFRPAAAMRVASGIPVSLDIQGTFSMDDMVSLGLGYRSRSALVGVMSVRVLESMTIGYAYDFGVSGFGAASRNSHEIVVSLSACDKNDPYIGPNGRCPAYD